MVELNLMLRFPGGLPTTWGQKDMRFPFDQVVDCWHVLRKAHVVFSRSMSTRIPSKRFGQSPCSSWDMSLFTCAFRTSGVCMASLITVSVVAHLRSSQYLLGQYRAAWELLIEAVFCQFVAFFAVKL